MVRTVAARPLQQRLGLQPVARGAPRNWRTLVNAGLSEEELRVVRECVGRGRPYGKSAIGAGDHRAAEAGLHTSRTRPAPKDNRQLRNSSSFPSCVLAVAEEISVGAENPSLILPFSSTRASCSCCSLASVFMTITWTLTTDFRKMTSLFKERSMTVSSIDKARETWDTIDEKAVRSVAWLSLSYIGRKVAFGLSPVHHAAQFVHNLLGQRIESYRRECLPAPRSSVAIWSRSACYSRLTSL